MELSTAARVFSTSSKTQVLELASGAMFARVKSPTRSFWEPLGTKMFVGGQLRL